MKRFQPGFAEEVLAESGGANLRVCLGCATCTAACPISWLDEDYNPRRILKLVALGAKDEVLSSPAIWLCSACDICYHRCPQNVHLSDVMQAIRNVAIREGYRPVVSPAQADRRACASCGLCVRACPYEAIKLSPVWVDGRRQIVVPEVNEALCHECGICTAICPVSAISVPGLGDRAIITQVKAFANGNGGHRLRRDSSHRLRRDSSHRLRRDSSHRLAEPEWKSSIVAFVCDWCLYSKLDRADIAGVEEQSGVEVVRIPCLGRMDPWHILTALQEGIDGVLVVGCQLGSCHYKHGNLLAEKKIVVLKSVLQAAGQSPRVKFAHVSSAERGVFPRLVEEMKTEVEALGPNRGSALKVRTRGCGVPRPGPGSGEPQGKSRKARARALTGSSAVVPSAS